MKRPRTYRISAFAVLAAALVIAASLSACGSGSSTSSATNAGSTAAGGSVKGLNAVWTDYGGKLAEPLRTAFVGPLQAQGMNIKFDSPTDYAKLQTQVKTNNVSWTSVQGDTFFTVPQCGKMIEDISKYIDLSKFKKAYVNDKCSVPGDTFTWLNAYDTNKYKNNPPKSWADFFDTKKFPGKRGVFGAYSQSGILEGALLADGVKPENLYPLDTKRAYKKLDTIRNDIVFYNTVAQAEQMMKSGDVSMIIVNPGSAYEVVKSGTPNWAPVKAQQILLYDPYFIPKGADMKAGLAILRSVADPRHQEALAKVYPVGTPAIAAHAKQPADVALWTPEDPPKTIVSNIQYWAKNFDQVQNEYINWVSG